VFYQVLFWRICYSIPLFERKLMLNESDLFPERTNICTVLTCLQPLGSRDVQCVGQDSTLSTCLARGYRPGPGDLYPDSSPFQPRNSSAPYSSSFKPTSQHRVAFYSTRRYANLVIRCQSHTLILICCFVTLSQPLTACALGAEYIRPPSMDVVLLYMSAR
jgi:hypothetical protein